MFYEIAFPGGTHKALTFSYDDGQIFDRKLVEMFNKYGVKATFHLNAGTIGTNMWGDEYIEWGELKDLYKGHEVSCHGLTHPFFSFSSKDQIAGQLWEERKLLEKEVCYPVRGMSYPYGDITDQLINIAGAVGMEYSRTVGSTGYFNLPDNFMKWDPTCHHNDAGKYVDEFLKPTWRNRLGLFYIWGHSFEFEREGTWGMMEELLQKLSNQPDVWYATNIEIKDYLVAARNLNTTADGKYVYNTSSMDITIDVGGAFVIAKAGQVTCLE